MFILSIIFQYSPFKGKQQGARTHTLQFYSLLFGDLRSVSLHKFMSVRDHKIDGMDVLSIRMTEVFNKPA